MRNEKSQFNNIGISSELDMPRIRHLMKIGLATGVMALIGDILVGNFGNDRNPIGVSLLFCGLPTDSPEKRKICAYIPHRDSWLPDLRRLRRSCALLCGSLFPEEDGWIQSGYGI